MRLLWDDIQKSAVAFSKYDTERGTNDKIHVDVKAAEKVAKLHNGLKSFGYEENNLEVYLVRLLQFGRLFTYMMKAFIL